MAHYLILKGTSADQARVILRYILHWNTKGRFVPIPIVTLVDYSPIFVFFSDGGVIISNSASPLHVICLQRSFGEHTSVVVFFG
jgi:hypothetical protein